MGDEELIKIVPVTNGPEYDDIQATFRRNSPSSRIISIERIQNKTLYLGYQALKKKFEVENPNIRNEVDGLWHGTAEGSVNGINKSGFNRSYCGKNGEYIIIIIIIIHPPSILAFTNEVHGLWHGTAAGSVNGINESGFNRSYCGRNATVFGEGVYFARDIRYSASHTYSTPDHYGIKRIYKCSVLVGRVMQGYYGLKVLQDSYNSAADNIYYPSVYVIFHDFQAYPNYLITFYNYRIN
ncbi:protein mono-ADP-ribosyltransferase PARP14-like [Octopus bimaculoides]|nr:protein mono-ADP-ribosyltransferase PARP14-like [Octopus bimaculoides]